MGTVMRSVEEYYRTLIADLSVGDRLPSERRVTEELGTCRSTVRIVLTKLCAEKLITPVQGKGYYKEPGGQQILQERIQANYRRLKSQGAPTEQEVKEHKDILARQQRLIEQVRQAIEDKREQ